MGKNKAYFKRFQVKWRRRREGKTDYYARKRLINQEKNKYFTPKFRLVVRFTNKDIIAQIVSAKIIGDEVLTCAYAHALTKLGLADKYQATDEVSGDVYIVDELDDEGAPHPFKAVLDVGLKRTTTGSRCFGVMKGAADGGLLIPHNEKRFPGYDRASKEYDPEVHKSHIMGEHVGEYMTYLQEEDPGKYERQFKKFLAAGINGENISEMYEKVHEQIKANPVVPKKVKTVKTEKRHLRRKMTYSQRKDRVNQKKKAYWAKKAQDE